MAALLASCSCGSNSKETSEAELNDSTKTAIEMENKRIEELVKFYEQFHTVRDLIDISAERFTNKPFIKYVDGNGEIVEKKELFLHII